MCRIELDGSNRQFVGVFVYGFWRVFCRGEGYLERYVSNQHIGQ